MAVYREVDGNITREYLLDEEQEIIRKRTERGLVEIVPTLEYGLALFIDNELQLTEKDEHIYHEMLVHPIMSSCKNYYHILVIGGGDGCAVREILKWSDTPYKQIFTINVIDWDEELVNLFKNRYSQLNLESLENEKVSIENIDITECDPEVDERTYDCIFIDLVDPVFYNSDTMNISEMSLWNHVLYLAKHWRDKHGSIVMNCGGILPWQLDTLNSILELLQNTFSLYIHLYKVFVPSFGRDWCFVILSEEKTLDIFHLPHGLRYCSKKTWQYAYKDGWTEDYLMNLNLNLENQFSQEDE